ncbi:MULTISPECIES: hypothetical protein [Clostridium]|uniref:hypothetical protein n=1 Tax=Clostridium TaxID=1485 RepID=UPI0008259685|nr:MULTISPECIES: hypothetical protein [Clostridium]PJI06561.1 hypothetical protein CUB90_01185 [Clostridium sp. CT7]
MFICKSYINRPEMIINNLNTINNEWKKYFIEVSDKNSILEIADDLDLNYLEGVIYLKYGDKIILDFKLWDYVDQLWAYIFNMLEEFMSSGCAEMLFPDQPVKIKLKSISEENIIMTLEENICSSWTLPKNEFISTLLNAGEIFFKDVTKNLNLDEKHYEAELSQIQELKLELGKV